MAKILLLEKGRSLRFILAIIGCFFLVSTGWGQTVTSDKADYVPGETALITGAGWQGDSIVNVHFNETPVVDHIHDYHNTTVDSDGNFVINFPILERHLGVAFEVEVVGVTTGRTAFAYFTDGSWTISQNHEICTGESNTLNFTVTTTGGTPNGGFKINFPTSFTLFSPTINSGVTGWSISVSGNSVCIFNNGGNGNRLSNGDSMSFNITVNASSAGTYQLSGFGTTDNGSCPLSGISQEPIPRSTIVVNAAPTTPGAITQPTNKCAGSTGNVFSIAGVDGATSYTWSVTGTGWAVIAGQGTTSAAVTIGTGAGSVSVTASNGSCTSAASTTGSIIPTSAPATPGTITQPTNQCASSTGNTFSIAAVPGATSYTWTATGTGWSVSGGQGTTSATVTIGTGDGSVSVTATNSCGTSAPSTTGSITPTTVPTVSATNLPASGTISNSPGLCRSSVAFGANVTATGTPTPTLTYSLVSGDFGSPITSPHTFPVGTTTVYVRASNSCGSADAFFTVKVNDTEDPTIVDLPGNIEVSNDAGVCGATVSWTAPTSADNCTGSTIAQTAGSASGSVFPVGTTTITYTATDAAGNDVDASFTVKVNDTEDPTIVDLPGNIEVSNDAGVCGATVSWTAPTSADNCTGSTIAQTAGSASGSVFPVGTTTITYTATDAAGNDVDASFTVKVNDTEDPTIVDLPGNIEVSNDAGVCGATVSWTALTSADNCTGSTIAQTAGSASGSVFPVGTTTITYTATDAAGNDVDASFTVKVNDTEDPTIVDLPGNIEVSNDAGVCGATVSWTAPTSADNCTGSTIAQTAGSASGSVFPVGTTTITYTATDAAGNDVDASFTVKVNDTEDPTIVDLPGNIEVSNDAGVCGATVSWTAPTSADNCTGSTIAQTAGSASGSVFPVGTTTITYTATDAAGNDVDASFTVKVNDTEDPTIVDLPGNIEVSNDAGVCGATVSWTAPTSADNCTGSTIAQTAGSASGSVFPVGTTTITYTATDAAGNDVDASFTVKVNDTEDPTIVDLPGNIEVSNDAGVCGATVSWTAPTSADNCTGSTIAQTAGSASGSVFPVGTTTITYTATDAAGNDVDASFTVKVNDTEDPTIVDLPGNIEVSNDAGVCGATVSWTAPTSADNCTGSTIAQTAGSASGSVFPVGTTTITYTATDAAGNDVDASFTVKVNDTEDPTIVDLPGNIEVSNDAGVCGATVSWTAPTSADNCTGSTIAQTAGSASGSVFPVGTTTITYTATDAAGNDVDASFTVKVNDTEDPTIVDLPGNIEVSNDAGVCGATVSWTAPTSADNCTGSTIAQTAGSASGSVFPVGTTTITYTATDAAGNDVDASFTVKVNDTEDPTIVDLPGNIEVSNDAGVCGATVSWTALTSADNCTGSTIAQTAGSASGSVFPVGTTTITYTATDAAGNDVDASFTVKVNDTEDPTIVDLPGNIEVSNDAGVCGATVSWTAPTSADNCTGSTIAQTAGSASGSVFPVGTTTITYTATDAAGNDVDASFTVKVNDTEDPTIVDLPGNIEVSNDAGVCGATVSWTAPTSADNCTGSTIAQTAGSASGSVFPVGTTTITYTATDAAGNDVDASFTVKVNDTEDPTIVDLPGNIEVSNDAGVCGATVSWTAPTSADNCTGSTIAQTAGSASGSVFPVGTTTITYTATDAAGNDVDASFTVKVNDTEDPTIVDLPGNIEVSNDAGVCGATVSWTAPTSADNCTGSTIAQTAGSASGSVFPVGTTTITYTATDAAGNDVDASFTVKVNDTEDPTIVDLPGNIEVSNDAGVCGATVSWTAPTSADNCTGSTIAQTAGSASGSVFPVGTTTITYTATDAAGNDVDASFTVKVTNEAPVIYSISGPIDPVQVNTGGVKLTASYEDNNVVSAKWSLIANEGVVTEYTCTDCIGEGTIEGNFNPQPGVYTVELEVTDACGATAILKYEYIVIFDPTGGFVTGGGWIESPVGAMEGDKYGVTGRANFGFNAKYKTGKNNLTEVDGHTNFQFKAGDLHFSSFEHEDMSLVIAGKKATYTGYGTVNGSGVHRFRVIAIDGQANGGIGPDQFRIKIWGDGSNSDADVLYDNHRGVAESSDLATTLGGGSIVIHKPKGGGKMAETTEKLSSQLVDQPVVLDILGNLAVAPNPVKTDAAVRFSLIEDANVTLRIFDFQGREVNRLFQGSVRANEVKEVNFQRNNLMSGSYIVKLTTDRGHSYDKQIIVE